MPDFWILTVRFLLEVDLKVCYERKSVSTNQRFVPMDPEHYEINGNHAKTDGVTIILPNHDYYIDEG